MPPGRHAARRSLQGTSINRDHLTRLARMLQSVEDKAGVADEMLSTHGRHAGGIMLALLLALLVLVGSAWSRGTEYDEDYSVFIATGTPRPVWPSGTFTPRDTHMFFTGHSTMTGIASDLRHNDVHPPLYFWSVAAWRGVFGSSLFESRLLSVLFSLIALLGVAALARLSGAPPVASVLLTLGCYGFTYTGSIARGFALAQLCMIWGTVLIVRAAARSSAPALREERTPDEQGSSLHLVGLALAGGVLLGLASFSNYLAAFGGAASLLWLLIYRTRQWPRWFAAGLGFACILPLDLYFFLAQRSARVGQFPPFKLLPSLARLGKYASANVFGGLPLYVGHIPGLILGALLVLALAGLVALVALRWRVTAGGELRVLLVMAVLATPVGLLLLGFVFNNTPIELRYIAFAMPFWAVLLAGTFASLPQRAGMAVLSVLLGVQALSIAGLLTRPETMQPQAHAAHAAQRLATATSLTLVPYGNDGVGVLAAFVNESPDTLHIRRVDPGESVQAIRTSASQASRVVLVLLGLDADSRAVLPVMQRAFEQNECWKRVTAGPDIMAFDRSAACSAAP